ncbi:hypothetical protein ACHAXM_010053 [Skeletonema potamos]|jgi:hypothetical protein
MIVAATCPDDALALKLHCERIDLTLKQCQSDASKNSPALIDSLQTLYYLLIEMKPMALQSKFIRSKVKIRLRDVVKDLIRMNRVIMSIDDEVDGVVRQELDDDFGWYREVSDLVARTCIECDGNNKSINESDEYNSPRYDTERWIDKCIDLCGYGVSLEAAVDCLRSTVRHSSNSNNNNNNDITLKQEGLKLGVASTVTSLRTIRRYLLHVPSLYQEGYVHCCPITFQLQFFSDKDASYLSTIESLWKCCILPMEYHCKHMSEDLREMESEPLLSDSLTDLTSVLPILVSSACHAMDLPLPWWASPKMIHTILLQAAWKTLLIGDLVGNQGENTSAFCQSTATYVQLLAKQMIQNGQSAIISKYFFHFWGHCHENDCDLLPISSTPRSMLSTQCRVIIDSISSNRTAATFYREMLRCSAKHYAKKIAQDEELNMACKQNILPFLQDTILQPLVDNEELRDAMVNFTILSPPSSFQHCISSAGCPSLSCVDRAVPRCVTVLLYLACISGQSYDSESANDPDSDHRNATASDGSYLSHLYTVASIWSEDVFVSRSDVLQQQFVTEFLLYPMQQNLVSQDEFQKGISGKDMSLATSLVQGISLRLDISLSQSIRMDGMRVAEAMASLLGQHLRFDELHPAIPETLAVKEEETKVQSKSRNRKGTNRMKPAGQQMIDPDAEYESDSSSSQSECSNESSMNSSWGEDSLEAYSLDDDEEDLRRVLLPRTLQDCFSYLVAPDKDNLACDKQQAALLELGTLVESKPFDLIDMTSTLVRVLLHLEDKYGMSMFAEKKWECLLAFGIHAPLDTCVQLVEEMKGGVSLGTRLEALSIIAAAAERLSVSPNVPRSPAKSITYASAGTTSTRLKIALGLREGIIKEVDGNVVTTSQTQTSKTRRWRQPRTVPKTTTNKFGPVAPHMIYSLFALMASTKENSSIWGGSSGERFLSEFIKTLAIMVDCASTYPSHSVSVLVTDLFELAWSFHDANSVEVRRAVLLAMATCLQMMPMDAVASSSRRWVTFLKDSSIRDTDDECRKLSTIMMGIFADINRNQFIE